MPLLPLLLLLPVLSFGQEVSGTLVFAGHCKEGAYLISDTRMTFKDSNRNMLYLDNVEKISRYGESYIMTKGVAGFSDDLFHKYCKEVEKVNQDSDLLIEDLLLYLKKELSAEDFKFFMDSNVVVQIKLKDEVPHVFVKKKNDYRVGYSSRMQYRSDFIEADTSLYNKSAGSVLKYVKKSVQAYLQSTGSEEYSYSITGYLLTNEGVPKPITRFKAVPSDHLSTYIEQILNSQIDFETAENISSQEAIQFLKETYSRLIDVKE